MAGCVPGAGLGSLLCLWGGPSSTTHLLNTTYPLWEPRLYTRHSKTLNNILPTAYHTTTTAASSALRLWALVLVVVVLNLLNHGLLPLNDVVGSIGSRSANEHMLPWLPVVGWHREQQGGAGGGGQGAGGWAEGGGGGGTESATSAGGVQLYNVLGFMDAVRVACFGMCV